MSVNQDNKLFFINVSIALMASLFMMFTLGISQIGKDSLYYIYLLIIPYSALIVTAFVILIKLKRKGFKND
jgi:hypothetical protein